jgi:hypothetical protein
MKAENGTQGVPVHPALIRLFEMATS